MKVTQVSVQIHEKRDHPHEYGHYDASVTLTANLDEGESYLAAVPALRAAARTEVQLECDGWSENIRTERLLNDIRNQIAGLRWSSPSRRKEIAVELRDRIGELPFRLQDQWLENLDAHLSELAKEEEEVENESTADFDTDDEERLGSEGKPRRPRNEPDGELGW